MNDDTIYQYLGREAEWVALCGFHHVESSSDSFTEADAAGLIDFVWEFCTESCKRANAALPERNEAIARLALMIRDWNANAPPLE